MKTTKLLGTLAFASDEALAMSRPPPQSFLLRLWREPIGAPTRATLVPVSQPAAQQHFADLEALYAFLHAQTNAEPIVCDAASTTHCTPLKSH